MTSFAQNDTFLFLRVILNEKNIFDSQVKFDLSESVSKSSL